MSSRSTNSGNESNSRVPPPSDGRRKNRRKTWRFHVCDMWRNWQKAKSKNLISSLIRSMSRLIKEKRLLSKRNWLQGKIEREREWRREGGACRNQEQKYVYHWLWRFDLVDGNVPEQKGNQPTLNRLVLHWPFFSQPLPYLLVKDMCATNICSEHPSTSSVCLYSLGLGNMDNSR